MNHSFWQRKTTGRWGEIRLPLRCGLVFPAEDASGRHEENFFHRRAP